MLFNGMFTKNTKKSMRSIFINGIFVELVKTKSK